jgi:hypothetical protein
VHLALIKYTVLRLTLFVVSLIVLWAVVRSASILLFVAAAAISLILSYLLLGKQRQELAEALADRVDTRVQRRHGEAVDGEDAAEDRAAAELVGSDEVGAPGESLER